jgi:LCP family protein required for cell wall assembly
MAFASFYILKTSGILLGGNVNYKTYNFSVLVLKDSGYEEIEDLENKTLGYYETSNVDSDLVLEEINKEVDASLKDGSSYEDLVEKLLNGELDSIVMEDSYLSMLEDGDYSYEGIDDFIEKSQVIYTFSIKVEVEDISKDLDVTKKVFNIYISGMDEYGTVSSVSRSDVNIIATINPQTKQILLTSIPRDYYVQVNGTTGLKDKLTHAGLYGVESSVATIEDLLGIEINYYVKVNFTSVVEIIDAIDGVEVYSEYDFTSKDSFHYSKGYNKVNGEEALSFARERYAFAAGDNQRGKNQQALIEAIIRKCTSSSIIYKYNSLLKSIDGSFITNMSSNRITSLIKMQLNDMSSWTVTSNNLVGNDSYEYTYSYSSQKLYVMVPDEESIEEASALINSVMEGETLESSYAKEASNVQSVYKSSKTTTSSSSSSSSSNKSSSSSTTTTNNDSSSNMKEENSTTTDTTTSTSNDSSSNIKEENSTATDTTIEDDSSTSNNQEEDNDNILDSDDSTTEED